ncbi:hypothetical protein LTR53_014400 [Teratosphaeriaceae sp. CCFEE 6253]|nr:hypothetical protein LTR53_014400 [Teratosphaeriaceae sp. CCFEE 6253]
MSTAGSPDVGLVSRPSESIEQSEAIETLLVASNRWSVHCEQFSTFRYPAANATFHQFASLCTKLSVTSLATDDREDGIRESDTGKTSELQFVLSSDRQIMLCIFLILIASAAAAVVNVRRAVEASPSATNYAQEAKQRVDVTVSGVTSTSSPTITASASKHKSKTSSSTRKSTKTKSHKSSSTSSSTITAAPALAKASADPSCTIVSICMDAITCGIRYGGCYDKNYCDGNTSPVAIPTCIADPAAGLTSRNRQDQPAKGVADDSQ